MARKVIDINEVRDDKQARRSFITGRRIAFIIAIVLLAVFGTISFRQIQNLKNNVADVKAELEIKEEQKSSLEEELAEVGDPSNVEKQARERLRMVKPGEVIYIYKDSVSPEEAEAPATDDLASEE